MKRLVGLLGLLGGAILLMAAQPVPRSAGPESPIERGRYIVERVAMCIECHTPRDGSGSLITTRLLQGAPIPVSAPPFPNQSWAFQAPAIAGLVGYVTEEEVQLLTQGIVTRTGKPPTPPMPRFRMTRQDAEAVIAFLRSLK
ncbi:MAG TPA: cytochrome c [Candidatus Sulfotelmatobacter sp.]|nr:cytochrome c [Candidatus Sulfotelmatobacter sp.]